MIPLTNVLGSYEELRGDIDVAIRRVLKSGWYILGAEVESFEADYAAYCQASHCVGVANGLDALILGLRIVGVGPGDEVIVPSNTYIATWLAVSALQATPVPVEPDPHTHCLDPGMIERAITSRTKAIMPVHLYGHPADMGAICRIAKARGVYVVEDAAQAHAAKIGNAPIGAHGDVVSWSFYPTKSLGAFGDAGALTTNDARLAERAAILRNYGMAQKNIVKERGMNSRLDPIQAAILAVKLRHLDEWRVRREKIAAIYTEGLSSLPLVLPTTEAGMTHGWHLYVVRCANRSMLQQGLTAAGITSAVHYPIPPYLQEAYVELGARRQDYPIATKLADEVLSLPIGPHLEERDARRIVAAIHANFADGAR